MTEEHRQKIRQTHLRLAHGENWTEEDQKEFEKARNDRHANNWRRKHRDTYNACMKRAQDKLRKEKPYYYRVASVEPLPSRQPNDNGTIRRIQKTERSKKGAR